MTRHRLIALPLLCAAPLLAQADTIRIVTDVSYPPFSKVDAAGNIVGFDPDIARAVCAEAKLRCEVKTMDFDGIIPALQAKKFDMAVASMNITPERAKAVDFSDMYFNIPGRLVAKAGTKVDDGWFKGKTIGVLRTSIQREEATAKWVPKGVKLKLYGKVTDSFLDLANQRLDAVYLDANVGDEDFLKKPMGKGYAFVGPVYNDPKYYMGSGMAIQKGNQALRDKVNAALKTLIANGSYKKIQDRYFSYDIYPFK